jgi:signal transduction histidine kinase
MSTSPDQELAEPLGRSCDANYLQGMELLVTVVQELSLARDLPTLTGIVRRAARHICGADGATFILRDGEQSHYVDEDAIGPLWKGQKFPMTSCVSGWSMLERTSVAIEDIYGDARVPAEAYRPTFVKSLVIVPIRSAEPIGAIGSYWATPHCATAEEIKLLQALADSTSIAMENIRLCGDLERRIEERTAQLETANRELATFSYSVSHDLQAPLRRMMGFSALLVEQYATQLDAAGCEYLQRVHACARSMSEIVEALLQLSRLGQAELHRVQVDLSQLATAIVAELRRDEPARNVTVTIEPGLTAGADRDLARIVLENLLRNAWKFTIGRADARITVGVASDCPAAPLEQTSYYVRDNGAGFSMEHAGELFLPFRRLHSGDEFPGTGVGLATVQRIVDRHGGVVWAEGAVGAGASFYWTFGPQRMPD